MQEKVFARRVSGVIRTLDFRDSVYFGFLTGAGLYWICINVVWGPYMFPGANPWIAVVLAGVFSVLAMVAYGMLGSAMPRSGGEYVFQSRTLFGLAGWLFTGAGLGIWNIWYSYMAAVTVWVGMISPFLGYMGFIFSNPALLGIALWITDAWTLAVLSAALIIASTLVMYKGMGPFLRIQRYFMAPFSFLGLLVLFAVLVYNQLFYPSAFVTNFNSMAASFAPPPDGGWYAGIISKAVGFGYNPNPGFNWSDTIGLAVVASPAFYYCGVTTLLQGEIKGSESLKTSVRFLVWAALITFVTYLIAFSAVLQFVGMPFASSIGFLQFEHPAAVPLPAAIYFPLPGYMLTTFLSTNPLVALLVGLGFLGVISQSLFNSPIGATRVFFAASMDRILPDSMSRVNKYGTPWNAMLIIQAIAAGFVVVPILLPQIAGFQSGGSLSGAVMFAATLLGAVLFPRTAKGIYDTSPAAKYKIGGLPAVAVFGALGLAWSLVMAYITVANPGFGVRGVALWFTVAVWLFLLGWYLIAKWYRARQGIDFGLAFKDVPPA